jgi:hypothetical protein
MSRNQPHAGQVVQLRAQGSLALGSLGCQDLRLTLRSQRHCQILRVIKFGHQSCVAAQPK